MLDFMLIYFFVNLQLTTSQFANHVDLQKVTEVMFKNEKYYVLKPTIHIIEDYFQTFVLKRNNKEIPSDKVFIDNDGFRHFWKGMVLSRPRSLRKADISQLGIKNYISKDNKTRESIDNNKKMIDKIKILNPEKNKNLGSINNKKEIIEKIKILNQDDNKNILIKNNSQTIKIKEKPRRKQIKKSIFVPAKPVPARQGTTQIKTTFFCPHFGVIRMTANVENFDN